MIEAKLLIVQAHKPSLLETNDSTSVNLLGAGGIELVEFLARGARSEGNGRIPCSWCNKDKD